MKGKGSQFRYYVLGGLALDTTAWYPLRVDLEGLLTRFFGAGHPKEVHFSAIRRRKPPFNRVDSVKLMDELIDLLVRFHPTLFAMVLDKREYQTRYAQPDPIPPYCLDALISRYQEFLQRVRDQGALVSDRSTHESDDALMREFERMKKTGTKYVAVNRIMDTLFFAPSETAVGLQLADITSNVVFRHFERGDSKYFNRIHPLFDRTGETIHGLRVFPT